MIKYYKLLDYLNRRGIGKEELRELIGVSSSTIAKIGKHEPVSLSVIDKICKELECQPGDILEYYEQAYDNTKKRETNIAIIREPLEEINREVIDVRDEKQHEVFFE